MTETAGDAIDVADGLVVIIGHASYRTGCHSPSRISSMRMAEAGMRVPGPKIAATPAR